MSATDRTAGRGRGVGSWGDFGSFSMQRSKLMTAGEWFYHHAGYGSNLR